MNQEEIDAKIAALNQAEYDYDQASTPEQEKAADIRFSTCWDWLIENKVPFYRNTKERVYRYGKKPVCKTVIHVNPPTLNQKLQIHSLLK